MDSLTQKGTAQVSRTDSFSAVWFTLQSVARWLVGFFKLNQADRFEAGIYLGYEGQSDKQDSTDSSST